MPFLGHIVGRRGLECDPKKIEDVKSWPIPDCLKSVRQFLGFVGYYRRFIPRFADIATPLVYLTGKDVPFVWDSGCSDAFHELRAALIGAPILAFPTETGQYILDTDASNFGLGGVLSQIQNEQERVVAYCSRALRPSQRRYCTTNKKLPERPVTVVGPEGWQRTTFPVLSCIVIRRSFGTDADASEVGGSFLLVGYGG